MPSFESARDTSQALDIPNGRSPNHCLQKDPYFRSNKSAPTVMLLEILVYTIGLVSSRDHFEEENAREVLSVYFAHSTEINVRFASFTVSIIHFPNR